ncbi:glycoside hydrolase [Bimuria novae-zelandiae CBS 107.79]|uniref:Beta-mannosidase B n=1 Tax=Bimuria novae-zelandiae CBS 107.79 TaxID=1447943 RepID=A0A6A5UYZ8_9PLEO|nr:glycoside hydrolase [Bimuria novae-zelandiae CBS 107.79]
MAVSRTELKSNWTFKQGDLSSKEEYLPANPLPTEIHLDLLSNKKIADPFKDFNELSVRWVAEESWTYRTTFPTPTSSSNPGTTTVLKFGGLDTFAHVYLNGKTLLESDNMFVEHVVDVTGKISASESEENVLEIVFESARQKGLELVEQHKEHRFIVHQTEISRGPVRKAQYHWGWDWGPILMSAGPWKPIVLETFESKIVDVWVEYEIDDELKQVEGKVFVEIEGEGKPEAVIEKDGREVEKLSEWKPTVKKGVLSAEFEIPDAELWWPRGYGKQALYNVAVSLRSSTDDHTVIDTASKTTGFRKVELVQEDDSHGTSFFFRINNVDAFCGGSCWIPSDSFLTRTKPDTYRAWIKQAADGNQAMVRVWGGGIYEDTSFFAAADELGVLIWQDFAFACASYPAHASYLSSVELEARQNVRHLRNHPSLIIWAGNNEDYQIVERYGLEYRFEEDKDPASWLKTDFPARYIYEYLLPKVISEETKGVPYHPSSPFGNGTTTTLKVEPTVGDIHQWNVWHGTMEPYQRLPEMGGRFVSEFGMEAYPHVSTLAGAITNPEDRYPGSMALDFRNKAIGHERRLVSYVAENFRLRYDLAGWTHLTQIMQSDALTWAYRSWRRDWGQGRKCGGVLVWQLNDCWPTSSWAVIDYHGVPKPSYHAIRRALAPLTVNVQRRVLDWTLRRADALWQRDTSHIDPRALWQDVQFDVWVASCLQEPADGNVSVRFISVRTGEEVAERIERAVRIQANGTTDVLVNHCPTTTIPKQDPNAPFDTKKADPFVIYTKLEVYGKLVATDVSWPEPIKYLSFADRGVKVEYSEDGKKVYVEVDKPVKGFVFEESAEVRVEENGFDVVPGERREVRVRGGRAEEVGWRFVDMA